jgi:hypothetical protein
MPAPRAVRSGKKNDAGSMAHTAIAPTPSYTLLLPAVAGLPGVVTLTGNRVTFSTSPRRIPLLWDAFGVEMRHVSA